ncbi:Serine/threonine-protein kinase pim-3 [Irineochytrium annulatum]|nr:Serine/threonine-protein kinase pim-3 [Irineochytrium annulatum]
MEDRPPGRSLLEALRESLDRPGIQWDPFVLSARSEQWHLWIGDASERQPRSMSAVASAAPPSLLPAPATNRRGAGAGQPLIPARASNGELTAWKAAEPSSFSLPDLHPARTRVHGYKAAVAASGHSSRKPKGAPAPLPRPRGLAPKVGRKMESVTGMDKEQERLPDIRQSVAGEADAAVAQNAGAGGVEGRLEGGATRVDGEIESRANNRSREMSRSVIAPRADSLVAGEETGSAVVSRELSPDKSSASMGQRTKCHAGATVSFTDLDSVVEAGRKLSQITYSQSTILRMLPASTEEISRDRGGSIATPPQGSERAASANMSPSRKIYRSQPEFTQTANDDGVGKTAHLTHLQGTWKLLWEKAMKARGRRGADDLDIKVRTASGKRRKANGSRSRASTPGKAGIAASISVLDALDASLDIDPLKLGDVAADDEAAREERMAKIRKMIRDRWETALARFRDQTMRAARRKASKVTFKANGETSSKSVSPRRGSSGRAVADAAAQDGVEPANGTAEPLQAVTRPSSRDDSHHNDHELDPNPSVYGPSDGESSEDEGAEAGEGGRVKVKKGEVVSENERGREEGRRYRKGRLDIPDVSFLTERELRDRDLLHREHPAAVSRYEDLRMFLNWAPAGSLSNFIVSGTDTRNLATLPPANSGQKVGTPEVLVPTGRTIPRLISAKASRRELEQYSSAGSLAPYSFQDAIPPAPAMPVPSHFLRMRKNRRHRSPRGEAGERASRITAFLQMEQEKVTDVNKEDIERARMRVLHDLLVVEKSLAEGRSIRFAAEVLGLKFGFRTHREELVLTGEAVPDMMMMAGKAEDEEANDEEEEGDGDEDDGANDEEPEEERPSGPAEDVARWLTVSGVGGHTLKPWSASSSAVGGRSGPFLNAPKRQGARGRRHARHRRQASTNRFSVLPPKEEDNGILPEQRDDGDAATEGSHQHYAPDHSTSGYVQGRTSVGGRSSVGGHAHERTSVGADGAEAADRRASDERQMKRLIESLTADELERLYREGRMPVSISLQGGSEMASDTVVSAVDGQGLAIGGATRAGRRKGGRGRKGRAGGANGKGVGRPSDESMRWNEFAGRGASMGNSEEPADGAHVAQSTTYSTRARSGGKGRSSIRPGDAWNIVYDAASDSEPRAAKGPGGNLTTGNGVKYNSASKQVVFVPAVRPSRSWDIHLAVEAAITDAAVHPDRVRYAVISRFVVKSSEVDNAEDAVHWLVEKACKGSADGTHVRNQAFLEHLIDVLNAVLGLCRDPKSVAVVDKAVVKGMTRVGQLVDVDRRKLPAHLFANYAKSSPAEGACGDAFELHILTERGEQARALSLSAVALADQLQSAVDHGLLMRNGLEREMAAMRVEQEAFIKERAIDAAKWEVDRAALEAKVLLRDHSIRLLTASKAATEALARSLLQSSAEARALLQDQGRRCIELKTESVRLAEALEEARRGFFAAAEVNSRLNAQLGATEARAVKAEIKEYAAKDAVTELWRRLMISDDVFKTTAEAEVKEYAAKDAVTELWRRLMISDDALKTTAEVNSRLNAQLRATEARAVKAEVKEYAAKDAVTELWRRLMISDDVLKTTAEVNSRLTAQLSATQARAVEAEVKECAAKDAVSKLWRRLMIRDEALKTSVEVFDMSEARRLQAEADKGVLRSRLQFVCNELATAVAERDDLRCQLTALTAPPRYPVVPALPGPPVNCLPLAPVHAPASVDLPLPPAAAVPCATTPDDDASDAKLDFYEITARKAVRYAVRNCPELEAFQIHRVVGFGANGVVLGALFGPQPVAIKITYKRQGGLATPREIVILRYLARTAPHANVLKHLADWEDSRHHYLVTRLYSSSPPPRAVQLDALEFENPHNGATHRLEVVEGASDLRTWLISQSQRPSNPANRITLPHLDQPTNPPPLVSARAIFANIAQAVHHLHRHGLVHLDIKPENVLVAGSDVVLADLGAAALASCAVSWYGTTMYTPPELLVNLSEYRARNGIAASTSYTTVDPRPADVFALGLLLNAVIHGPGIFPKAVGTSVLGGQSLGAGTGTYPLGNVRPDLGGLGLHLLTWMTMVRPEDRATMDDVMAHPWVMGASLGAF